MKITFSLKGVADKEIDEELTELVKKELKQKIEESVWGAWCKEHGQEIKSVNVSMIFDGVTFREAEISANCCCEPFKNKVEGMIGGAFSQ